MTIRILLAVLLTGPIAIFAQSSKTRAGVEKTGYLATAMKAGNWILSTSERGQWPDAIDQPERVTYSYGEGLAGTTVFFLELYFSSKKKKYLNAAERAGRLLVNSLDQPVDLKAFHSFSLYDRYCGAGFALRELHKATGKAEFKTGAGLATAILLRNAHETPDSLSWDMNNDLLFGLAGTGLYLLHTAQLDNNSDLIQKAVKVGRTLMSRAIKTDSTYNWRFSQQRNIILPNFSHGAAGIGYFFVKLFEATHEEEFMRVALRTEKYLAGIARYDDGRLMIPYGFPDRGWSRPFDLGWAHGSAGLARFYYALFLSTRNPEWMQKIEACKKTIFTSGVPLEVKPEFGKEPLDITQRFGLSGIADFLMDDYRISQDPVSLQHAILLMNDIVGKSKDENGMVSWPLKRLVFMERPGDMTSFTGFMYGAAGYGHVLLNMHHALKGTTLKIRFVDDPF